MNSTSQTFKKSKQCAFAWYQDLRIALVFLTRLPIKIEETIKPERLLIAMRAFPCAGALIGLCAGLVFLIAQAFGASTVLGAALSLLSLVVLCGALHEDGLADVCDGFFGGHDKERKLEIMRDSLLGSYGVLALIFSLLLRLVALGQIAESSYLVNAMIAIETLSRLSPLYMMSFLNPARDNGLAAEMVGPAQNTLKQALIFSIIIIFLCLPISAVILVLISTGIVFYGMIKLCEHHIGGYTGDTCGAAQQGIAITLYCLLAFIL